MLCSSPDVRADWDQTVLIQDIEHMVGDTANYPLPDTMFTLSHPKSCGTGVYRVYKKDPE